MRLTIATLACLASLVPPWAQGFESTTSDALLACRKVAEQSGYSVMMGGDTGHLDGVHGGIMSVETVDNQGQPFSWICEYDTATPLHLKSVTYSPSDCDCISWFLTDETLAEINAELASQK